MPIVQGTRLGRYEIGELLGAGGMGKVYLARDLTLHRPVAVKVLRAELVGDRDRLRRFELEAVAASSLNHPNILTIYEIGEENVGRENECHFIVAEFIDGESLAQHMERASFTLRESLEIGVQVASALAAAHAAGIVHRDIKPDNIMLRQDRLVKILDFGIAKLNEPAIADAESKHDLVSATTGGVVMGTVNYMSPEQARGLAVDARTDIWSLGVVLYQLAAGTLPFTGDTTSDVIASILRNEPPGLATYARGVPAELDQIVNKTLCKEVAGRYQQATVLGQDLEALKHRLAFEKELRRIGGEDGGGDDATRRPIQIPTDPGKAESAPTLIMRVATDDQLSRATLDQAYAVGQIKRHKLGVSLILAAIIVAALALAYFGYSRYRAASPAAGITSLAVLPFTNASRDPEQEYLSDGISESLISRLSRLPGVKVIANSSSSRYKGTDADPQAVAQALDVSAVVTGKILRRGDDLLISVELIDGRDRTLLWGQQYERKAADLMPVQAEISREIADALRLHLTAGQKQGLVARGTVKPEAYELLLKGRFHTAKGTIEDRRQAAEYFNQAIAADPGYSLAYAELSDVYRSLVNSGTLEPKEYLPQAMSAAERSLELDPTLAEAHYCLANLKSYSWQWADAEREYRRAIELNPNLALAHRWYASYLRLMGRNEQALAEIKRARELDPLSPGVNATLGFLLFGAHQYDQAIASLNSTRQMDQTYPYTHLYLAYTYAAKGMYEESIASYQEAIKLGLDTSSTRIHFGVAYARAGRREQALAIQQTLQTSADHVSPAESAMLYTALGDRERAFALLEQAYQERDLQLQYAGVAPEFDPLRSDPRFQDLLRRLGLAL